MNLKIILFEDNDKYGRELQAAFTTHLAGKGEIKLFRSSSSASQNSLHEDRLTNELQQPDYQDPTLIVADRDLSATKEYIGMSESVVKRVADMLGIPECAYARGEPAKDFMRDAEQREANIVLSLEEGDDKFAQQVVSIAEGFASITEKLPAAVKAPGKKSSPGKLLASILGKSEYADKIDLYASGDPNRLASVLVLRGTEAGKRLRLTCHLGYWLWDSVLRYPGVVVNEVAASSYLNIQEAAFKADPKLQAIFAKARYQGPFAGAKGPMWWRGMLDDIVAENGCADGREFAERSLRKSIPPSECCEDATKPAGYYCMLSGKPVSLENSKGGLAWFPRGADLARVSSKKYDELAPWF